MVASVHMSSSQRSIGIVPLAILAAGIALAVGLLAAQRIERNRFLERVQAVAVARAIIERGGAGGGLARQRILLEQLAADGESLADLDLRDAKLARIDLSGALLDFTQLAGAELGAAKLPLASLIGARLRGADLTRANAIGADFTAADLSRVVLSGAALDRADFTTAKLWNANLQGASLDRARFVRAYLVAADFRGADLSGAQLFESDLFEADLRGALLRGARLESARLKHANLSRSDLGEVRSSTLSAAQLRSACMDPARTQLPPDFVFDVRRYDAPDRCCDLWPDGFVHDAAGQCVPAAPDPRENGKR